MSSPGNQPPEGGHQPPGGSYQPPGGSYQPPGGGYQLPGGYPPPGYQLPPAGRVKVRPGRPWYLVALAVFLVGVAWLIIGFTLLIRQVDSFQRVPLPAGGRVYLASGGYVIYYEAPGANSSAAIPSFTVRVTPDSPGAAVGGIQPYRVSLTYGFGSHHGRAVLTLTIDHSGAFLVETQNAPVGPGADLAIGPSLGGRIVAVVLHAIALVLTGIGSAVVLLIVRIVLISRRRRRLV